MLNRNCTAKLLNLEDVIITDVENISEELHIHLELSIKKHTCPACGELMRIISRHNLVRFHLFSTPTIDVEPKTSLLRRTHVQRSRHTGTTKGLPLARQPPYCISLMIFYSYNQLIKNIRCSVSRNDDYKISYAICIILI